MNRYDYLHYSIKNELYSKLDWFYTFFAIQDKKCNTPYLRNLSGKFEVLIDKNWELLPDYKEGIPYYTMRDIIEVTPEMYNNTVPKGTTSTIGTFFANVIMIKRNFGEKIRYMNHEITIKNLEAEIAKGLNSNKITVDEYLGYVDGVSFLKGLSRIVTVAATPRNVLPPPNIDKIKENLIKEFNQKYGDRWADDRAKIVLFQEELKKVDENWLQDDPTLGKLVSGKVKDNTRVKMYLTNGATGGLESYGGKSTFIKDSLLEGYSKDKKSLVAMFNASRAGSFERGAETQKGGVVAKDILRASSSLTIEPGDCGTTLAFKYTVTKDNAEALIGRYLAGSKPTMIEDGNKLVGKTIMLRSPLYCKQPNGKLCEVCTGTVLSRFKSGPNLALLTVSKAILDISLEGMHDTQVKLVDVDMNEIIS